MKDEDFVRAAWETVSAGRDIYGFGVTLPTVPSYTICACSTQAIAWSAAAAFTRERQAQIAEVDEALEYICHCPPPSKPRHWIHGHLQSIRAELVKGMKEGA